MRNRLPQVGLVDANRLGRALDRLAGSEAPEPKQLAKLTADIERAEQALQRRRADVPVITFPPELPVAERADELAEVIAAHQVVVVAGETGSGKSTQLPKICLQLGRGVRGMIGHTQPRRIAARALAERIADETGTELGAQVGYAVRFGDHTSPRTLVKLMTDGILLAEIAKDRLLSRYDTIIIDEAHERSLNIDFLLGYLQQLLPRRPDLKVIITSATIDPQRFAAAFATADRPVPVVEVSGRMYPVEIRYRPYGADASDDSDDSDDSGDADSGRAAPDPAQAAERLSRGEQLDQSEAIVQAVDELIAEDPHGGGDILVFLSGEREITDTADVLRAHLDNRPARGGPPIEVLPLYGRLSAAEQHRVFAAHSNRRIVLATNVAETSITVPGVRYVIDPGTARISRYSTRTKVQRLPIEKISQASAGQRAGRCGRVADGICIRLYSEQDFDDRPRYTDPEIARTSLASVILQMAALDLGDIASFPFVDPPDSRNVADGVRTLVELGALSTERADRPARLTATGRTLAALPLDPQLARMIVEADARGCLAEVLVIVAALSIQDVREYPLEERDKATAAHSRFVDPHSDFLALLNLWHYLRRQAKALSGNAFRRMCRAEYLHYLRIREWQDLHAQLRQLARGLGMDTTASAAAGEQERAAGKRSAAGTGAGQQGKSSEAVAVNADAVHTALLAGLLSHVGSKLEPGREYQGTRGTRFVLWPGSALAKRPPAFVMAAELVETSRLWGRMAARIDPVWAEQVGAHLVQRNYSEPRWDAKRGSVVATEKVTLLGVVLIPGRRVQFDRIDRAAAREIFIRSALVEGELPDSDGFGSRQPWYAANQATLQRVMQREDRLRRRDLLVDDEALFELYERRLPADVTSVRHLETWWRKTSRRQGDLLTFTEDEVLAAGADVRGDYAQAYPDQLTSGGIDLDLDYVFDPASADDGVTVTIPLAVLARVRPADFSAHVPGARHELAVALLRTMPKSLRRNFVPAPDFAAAALARLDGAQSGTYAASTQPSTQPSTLTTKPEDSFVEQFAAALTAVSGIAVHTTDFDTDKLPEHLRMRFRVVDADGAEVATGKNLAVLQEQLRVSTRDAVADAVSDAGARVEISGLTTFPADGVAKELVREVAGRQVLGYPALVDEGATVGVRVFTEPADQRRAMRSGLLRLLQLAAPSELSAVRKSMTPPQLLTLATAPQGSPAAYTDDAVVAAIDALLDWAGGIVWNHNDFERVRDKLLPQLGKATVDVARAGEGVLAARNAAAAAVDRAAARLTGIAAAAVIDMRQQLTELVPQHFLTQTKARHLPDAQRYLQALATRADRAIGNPERDRALLSPILELTERYQQRLDRLRPERRTDDDVRAVARMLQEWRIAEFAQPMRTAMPVSAKRIQAAISALPD
ncbi:ATP-dependent RNA helicase HrpA [Nakamurella aerolata]|uniref:ATP-dependent RNA helicase HrpA n=1 Tax=Nakamurella aerolata TaxID=1656892 RepID=UPI003CCCB9C2